MSTEITTKFCSYCRQPGPLAADGLCADCAPQREALYFYKEFCAEVQKAPCVTQIIGYLRELNELKLTFKLVSRIAEWNTTQVSFTPAQKPIVSALADKLIEVRGPAYYSGETPMPDKMSIIKISEIKIDPNAPKLSEMWGAFPDITGGLSVQDYLRAIRSEDDSEATTSPGGDR